MSDVVFDSLPQSLQQFIDKAFDLALSPQLSSPRFKAQLDDSEDIGGGFLVDDPSEHAGGGFISEQESITDGVSNEIPLSLIPTALRLLDLPIDDEQVLSVFRNAASGWSSATNTIDESSISHDIVSREDWRSVCAVLLEHRADKFKEHEPVKAVPDSKSSHDNNMDVDDGDDSDEYHNSTSEYTSADSDDDYQVMKDEKPSRRRTRRHHSSSSLSPRPTQDKLTKKQNETCLAAFALFFPSVPKRDLPSQKITIKDIQKAASSINEKLKANEIVEMLEIFSTSPDKSMNLTDFSRMMIAAKLV
ncbi:hypothetical protein AMATHDRAFT_144930 [Amanita thiersii Skay4041]|uniref:EF-hand domain-containing protein n=1 Tax=Amanita thiersii Skay4041 TaxID=703135 RepID=A0A2A9NS28_9AGAR|nr:hypothetical protein AMATHDRAFT_144930 [Amanita thiersii Skay4041]